MARPHGTKYIETPKKMWDLFTEYKNSVKENPILVEDYVGKDAERVFRQKEQPLIFEGFECFVMDKEIINYPDLSEYFEGKNESYRDYFPICSRIKREIRHDQIKLGFLNLINPSITQRLNGLTEKTDVTTDGKPIKSENITIRISNPLEDID
jgi:hypothetical protein